MKRFVIAILILTTISNSALGADTIPFVVEKTPCQRKLEACDDALQACDKAVSAQMLLIENLNAENATLQRTLDSALQERAEAQAWYRQPSVVGPLAFILGIVVGIKASK